MANTKENDPARLENNFKIALWENLQFMIFENLLQPKITSYISLVLPD